MPDQSTGSRSTLGHAPHHYVSTSQTSTPYIHTPAQPSLCCPPRTYTPRPSPLHAVPRPRRYGLSHHLTPLTPPCGPPPTQDVASHTIFQSEAKVWCTTHGHHMAPPPLPAEMEVLIREWFDLVRVWAVGHGTQPRRQPQPQPGRAVGPNPDPNPNPNVVGLWDPTPTPTPTPTW